MGAGKRWCLAVLLALIALAGARPALAARDAEGPGPVVIATIAPLHSLVAALMAGAGSPRLLIAAGRSPHLYQLRPSEARALAGAARVFWIGEALEGGLARAITRLAGERAVALLEDPALRRTGADPHVWLDPGNAARMAVRIGAELALADPPRAPLYRANQARLGARLAALDRELEARLAPLGERPFVVLHPAFAGLAARYRLRLLGALTGAPGQPPGARTLARLARAAARAGARCLFLEPQVDGARLATALDALPGLRRARLDALGLGLTPGPELYFRLMRANAAALEGCLRGGEPAPPTAPNPLP